MTACCDIYTKQINTLCSKNIEFYKDKFNGKYIDHWALVDLWVY